MKQPNLSVELGCRFPELLLATVPLIEAEEQQDDSVPAEQGKDSLEAQNAQHPSREFWCYQTMDASQAFQHAQLLQPSFGRYVHKSRLALADALYRFALLTAGGDLQV
ncbi:hypothetical protein D3C79_981430 [compost metagenome]